MGYDDEHGKEKRKDGQPQKMCRAVENAIRGCGPCRPEPEPAGAGVEDVLMEVKDLSTGVYGEPYKVVC